MPQQNKDDQGAIADDLINEESVFMTIEKFLSEELPPRELLLSPWLPKQGLVMIHAPRGVGKTHVALAVGYAVATGGSFLGWHAPSPAGVLLLDGEMPATALQERLALLVAGNDRMPLKPFNILTPDMQPKNRLAFNIGKFEDQIELEAHLNNTGIDLIIVDNIATLCRTGKENEQEGWIPIQEWALRQRARGRSVLFVHHSGKSGMQRGTSSREDVLDTVIKLKRPSDYEPDQGARFEIHFEKARGFFGDDSSPIEARLDTDQHGHAMWTSVPLENALYERVIELHKDGLKQRDIAIEIDRDKSRVSRMLKKAREEGRISGN